MNELLNKVSELGVVPVVVLNDAKDAAPLAKALCEGGLPCAEVTFRTEAAEESIRIMARNREAYHEYFVEEEMEAGIELWLAMYTKAMVYEYKVQMWQYTSKGKVPGIDGKVDIDLYFPYH